MNCRITRKVPSQHEFATMINNSRVMYAQTDQGLAVMLGALQPFVMYTTATHSIILSTILRR